MYVKKPCFVVLGWRQSDMSFKDVIMVQFIDIHF